MAAEGRAGLRLSSARMLLLSAVFIILSGYVAEGRQCYWCGPLAEQVHRSPRAPPCVGAGRHITVCEPGYNYCAIVATSPPFLESRFCVKLYQDECYPLFCNSTKTWKMTCPCRGDLCNGASSEREEDAFAVLNTLTTKTYSRIQKRSPTRPLTGNHKGKSIVSLEPSDEEALTGNSVEEGNHTQNIPKQIETLIENTQTTYKEQVTQNFTDPMTDVTSTTNQPTANEKETQGNSVNSQSNAIDKTEPEISATEETPTSKKEIINGDSFPPTSTAMIEIDIKQKPSYYADLANEETNQQADAPAQDVQSEIDKETKNESEGKINDTTTDSAKSVAPAMTTSHSIPIEPSTMAVPVPKDESPTIKSAEVPQAQTEIHMSTTTAPTTANSITAKPTAKKNQTTKENNKNTAIRLSVNTLIIIQCILSSAFI